jgi:cysteine desulfurase/selenocysteine lyase
MSITSLNEIGSRMDRLTAAAPERFDARRIRDDFPILRQKIHGKPLIYLDNAATTQKPSVVLETLSRYYTTNNANIHRAVHQLAERATRAYELSREKVQTFLNAAESAEVIFVRGATEGINLVAQSWGRTFLRPGDEILVTAMEHHSNIVPWQLVAQQTGAVLRPIPMSDDGELLMDEFEKMLSARTKLVSVVHLSNSLGSINPVERIIELAHERGAKVLLDAAQSVAHLSVDVRQLDCDFLVFSGHKIYGPTGIGVLYGKRELLDAMPPWQGGGDMIHSVSFSGTTYAELPNKFEAGTPDIAGVIGLGSAIDYVRKIGLDRIAAHEDQLLELATKKVREMSGVRIIGNAPIKAGVLSFVVEHPAMSAFDVGTKLDLEGIAVRTGHHCCQPVMDRFGIPGTVRMSLGVYNTTEDIETFCGALAHLVDEGRRKIRTLPMDTVIEPCPADTILCASTHETCPPRMETPYASAAAETPKAAAEEIAEIFELFDDWGDRYQQLLDMGAKLPKMPPEMKTDCTRVHGCQSVVYLTARAKPTSPGVLEFLADSDGELVRGLIAVLEKLFSGQKARDILAFDIEKFFVRIGLDQHLSLNRRNGLAAMVQRIRQHAAGMLH